MNMTRLGKKGQVSIPKAVLDRLGLEPETVLLVESTADGAIVLRPAAVYPVEVYSEARVREFLDEDRMTTAEAARVRKRTGKR
ncbi:MAG TPA: AbrB/MazE/SpoVT family DNA-binding domain-containing protein [Thermoanaerobaculales bacterium]|nr:AbrB/MazE/SpoVT family DNA-binding domain-containing protein [Thermoanaerobaculales bacterium]HQL29971.1 AbrB/MazE/SpoVT family DNA-binding domain-containing protein [Thermoanaerobaculales bacterium]HQN96852.1 AbrB/MazE/SpoVT family DNA-binding domain-containing protein [Thermoanaerobaculales bacterium]